MHLMKYLTLSKVIKKKPDQRLRAVRRGQEAGPQNGGV